MSDHESDRRSFLTRAVLAGTGLISAGLAGLVAIVATPASIGSTKRWRKAASIFALPPDQPLTAVLASREDDGWYATRKESVVFIDREGNGYRAMSSICAHLGCRVKWENTEKHYRCPCHGGVYDREGRVLSGPPPRPLDRLNVRVNPATSDIEIEL